MKKILCLMMALAMSFMLFACGVDDDDDNKSGGNNPSDAESGVTPDKNGGITETPSYPVEW